MISQGRTYNVFLTKMDALLPETNYANSLSELLLRWRSRQNKRKNLVYIAL